MIGPMSDRRIRELCFHDHVVNVYGMIEPYVDRNVSRALPIPNGNYIHDIVERPIISYGTSSYGYDMRVAGEFKIFTNLHTGIIDPKNFNQLQFHEITIEENNPENWIIIPPNAFALARSVEYFRIPRNVIGIVLGKSTLARCGLICNITALESEWCGHLTIELSNTAPLPVKVYAFEGIAQAIFFECDEDCEVSYADKNGKYMNQIDITFPKV